MPSLLRLNLFGFLLLHISVQAMSDKPATKSNRPAKLQKLDVTRRRLPHISASAMSAVCQDVEKHGMPELHARTDFYDAAKNFLDEQTPFGPVVVEIEVPSATTDGEFFKVWVPNPLAFLYLAYKQGGSFTALVNATCAIHPPSPDAPWGLVFYSDEVVPGKELSHNNQRKVWMGYFSVLHFLIFFVFKKKRHGCLY